MCWAIKSSSIISCICSLVRGSTMFSSWLVRKPSKKCKKGTRARKVAAWEIKAMSMASCGLSEQSMAQPVWRTAITSEWSPKIDRAEVAIARADTWNTVGVNSPAILYILGIISSKPCEAVKVVVRAPAVKEPCTAPEAPPSDCNSFTEGTLPQMLVSPLALLASQISPMVEEGVIG